MHYKVVTPKERRDRLRLFRTARIGAGTYHEIMEHFGHATAALEAIPQMARNGGARPLRPVGEDEAERELEQIEALGGRIVTFGEPGYPPPLMLVKDAPPAIAVIGRADLLARDMVAVVGARNATANGRRVAREMGSELGVAGLTVVSGLARGIDRAAHEGSLGNGTVAVVAGGVDVPYPEENRELYEQICEVGVVVSEIAPGIRPTARHFPRRNRIISGLSLGVVIVEAAERSGSLITARLAMEQGREVFGVPGSPTDPRSRGPNRLIRDGANLVRDAADVIETLRPMLRELPLDPGPDEALDQGSTPQEPPNAQVPPDGPEMQAARLKIAESLSAAAITVDELVRECQLSAAVVQAVLLEFELAGHLERQPGGKVAAI